MPYWHGLSQFPAPATGIRARSRHNNGRDRSVPARQAPCARGHGLRRRPRDSGRLAPGRSQGRVWFGRRHQGGPHRGPRRRRCRQPPVAWRRPRAVPDRVQAGHRAGRGRTVVAHHGPGSPACREVQDPRRPGREQQRFRAAWFRGTASPPPVHQVGTRLHWHHSPRARSTAQSASRRSPCRHPRAWREHSCPGTPPWPSDQLQYRVHWPARP